MVRSHVKRDGIEDLLVALEHSDFYTAPASTKFHDSVAGGLVDHSIKVYTALLKLTEGKGFSDETLAIVAFFHDLCKIGFYKVDSRNVKVDGKWESVPYYSVDDSFPIGHGEKSIIMLMEHMKLTNDEIMAIRWHMGGFEPKESYMALSAAYGQCPLAVYLHMADLSATYIKN